MDSLLYKTLLCSSLTLLGYVVALALYRKYRKPWLNPLYTVTLFLLGMLSLFHINSENYVAGSSPFTYLLGTATVSLAIPLYKQVHALKKYLFPIFTGVVTGTLAGIISVFLISRFFHLDKVLLSSLLPKSVTIPIALSISNSLGGVPSLTILFVVSSGIFSLAAGPYLLQLLGVQSKIAKGLALGTSAQALGAGRALEWGEFEGAMGSVAMSLSALLMSVLSPFFIYLT